MSKTNQETAFQPWLGVFETVRVFNGQALLTEQHRSSFEEASTALGLPAPANFCHGDLRFSAENGRWRWINDMQGCREFFVPEIVEESESYSLELSPQTVGSHNWDARYKTFSYLTHWQARQSIQSNEALLLNEHGEVASGAMTNLFWGQGGCLFTPTTEAGCRNGALRRWILSNFHVKERREPLSALREASEIFLTNSMIGIKPVTRFLDRGLPRGPLSTAIHMRYQQEILRS